MVLQGAIELILALLSGLFIFFMSFKVFSLITREINEIQELKKNNIAVSILGSSFLFGIMLLIRTSISPAMDTLNFVLEPGNFKVSFLLFSLLRIVVMYLISAIFSFLILWLSVKIFLLLTTEIDEMSEINNNNISVSIVIATLIASMALLLSEPLSTILNSLVASPVIFDSGLEEHLINIPIFLQGVIELALSLVGGISVFFISFRVLSILTKNIDEIAELKKNNIAVAILSSSFIFGIMLLVRSALIPANDILGFTLGSSNSGYVDILLAILRIVLFLLLSAVIGFVVIWLAMKSFLFLTKDIDELKEIKANNIAIALIVAILVISAAFLIEHSVVTFLNGLIKSPEIGRGLMDLSDIK